VSMLETPSMKHEELFWIREKCKNMRDGSRFDLINCDFFIWFIFKK
jgi:hypothetical protein